MTRLCGCMTFVPVPILIMGFVVACSAAEKVPLSSLDLSKMTAQWGQPIADRSVQNRPLSIGGRKFEQGVGTHAQSVMWIDLKGRGSTTDGLGGR